FTDDQKERFLAIVCEVAAVVETSGAINVIKEDPDDNVILESAIVAGANFIVSGDPDLLNLKEFNGIKIVKPREFVEIFNKKP
ncbi:MAG TPA: putative toxin-antitoxin system toxin component, PIN family, partial [archaeon]|nr:putative toxin-antitoxin system toxin component, PIN family [archaeon]